ncbi:MAG: hypothetical protein Q7J80_08450, partial [Anaerolineales bacterium]|nr:hypothetical protein [Anaerolineales bacterium]
NLSVRSFLYDQFFSTFLLIGECLEPSVCTAQKRLKSFTLKELVRADAIKVIKDGELEGRDFLLREEK